MMVYVAGGSSERGRIALFIRALERAGLSITHNWTECEGYSRESTILERQGWAADDFAGVRAADIVWYVAPEQKSEGSHAEIGYALALHKRVVASGPTLAHGRIFTLLTERYETHTEALGALIYGAMQ